MNNVLSIGARLALLFCGVLLVACSEYAGGKPVVSNEVVVECHDPRPQMCTQEYRPVCATRDNGVRCVTTPCDSTENATYPNGCTACADPDVYAFRAGACARLDGAAK